MNRIERKGPWSVTFGFSRALQNSALATWRGEPGNVPAAHAALLARARANAAANLGKYSPSSEPTIDERSVLRTFQRA